jgi:hypothetical protein
MKDKHDGRGPQHDGQVRGEGRGNSGNVLAQAVHQGGEDVGPLLPLKQRWWEMSLETWRSFTGRNDQYVSTLD